MSLFGDLAGSVLGGALSNLNTGNANTAQLIPAAMQLINEHGGISGLIQQFQSGGLGGVVQSWIGSGQNQPVSGGQLAGVLNGGALAQFAQKLGVDPQQASALLAQVLPVVVDHLTPNGQVGEHDVLGDLAGKLLGGKLFG